MQCSSHVVADLVNEAVHGERKIGPDGARDIPCPVGGLSQPQLDATRNSSGVQVQGLSANKEEPRPLGYLTLKIKQDYQSKTGRNAFDLLFTMSHLMNTANNSILRTLNSVSNLVSPFKDKRVAFCYPPIAILISIVFSVSGKYFRFLAFSFICLEWFFH
ncbi:unnamed protein product [Protopolystoma xenopodis]|uniref:Uncharacterized protein n=1 Tax=Protopolystoma xenopodis TaxID=117903 RepID=A0A3S5B7C0_9PLAT|nr:unnamed protein product [Protopolystoma xenopodis]